ncbi:MAG: helix-turn-helix domain-containing protein [Burkholderiaceae bacterium]|nr:helix-turn-helix domain-containing protein [Burkholderiaceae bacterium]
METRFHTFTTEGHPAARGPNFFQQEMDRLYAVGLAISSPDGPFHTQVSGYCGRRLRFASLQFSAHRTSSSHVGRRGSRLLVSLHKEGSALVQQGGREGHVGAGDLFVIDPSRPFCIETGAQVVAHSVYLEADLVRGIVPDLDALTARPIRGADGTGALFARLMDEMFEQADQLREPTADRLADALPHLLSAALVGLQASEPATSRLRATHREGIRRFVRENLRNHELDARSVAAGVGLSTRYVYELFEEDGRPLMRWIWGSRLERCRDDLAQPAQAARSISEIAYSWGFNDMAHFSRAFRQRFGVAPREFRGAQARAANAIEQDRTAT